MFEFIYVIVLRHNTTMYMCILYKIYRHEQSVETYYDHTTTFTVVTTVRNKHIKKKNTRVQSNIRPVKNNAHAYMQTLKANITFQTKHHQRLTISVRHHFFLSQNAQGVKKTVLNLYLYYTDSIDHIVLYSNVVIASINRDISSVTNMLNDYNR